MTDMIKVMNPTRERPASTFNGYLMLAVALAFTALTIWGFVGFVGAAKADMPLGGHVLWMVLCLLIALLSWSGFYMIQPNQAAAITLFGAYRGTDRENGLRWVWPWMMRKTVSVRANNLVSEKLKVNDLRGNPIEIATQVVWRVSDTAQALFDIDDYREFVDVQIEAAVRTIGSRYPYDDIEENEVTLRGHHDEVSGELKQELQARLAVAGVAVDECGLTHLAYAPEIAGAMLRRQQAEAVIAARAKLVLGAVSMVDMALTKLAEDSVVELDDERRAAMVSNLMVVLCGESDAQPVVNAGTLYQG